MANTPQARKRIRRNNRRADVNTARVSRIRTFVKRVESAIEGGDKAAAAAAPTLTAMYERMAEDMDVNCGEIVDGTASVQDKGREIFELILRVASGAATKSEALGMGNDEFVPWQLGAVM